MTITDRYAVTELVRVMPLLFALRASAVLTLARPLTAGNVFDLTR